jgi:hypothetical protein
MGGWCGQGWALSVSVGDQAAGVPSPDNIGRDTAHRLGHLVPFGRAGASNYKLVVRVA